MSVIKNFSKPGQLYQHIRFGNLPKPDHQTGLIVDNIPSQATPPSSMSSQSSYTSTISFGSSSDDEEHGNHVEPIEEAEYPGVIFRDIKWTEDPHPGKRVIVNVVDSEDLVSPRTATVPVPVLGCHVTAQMFQEKFEDAKSGKVYGRRKVGMTAAHKMNQRRERRERENSGCMVQ